MAADILTYGLLTCDVLPSNRPVATRFFTNEYEITPQAAIGGFDLIVEASEFRSKHRQEVAVHAHVVVAHMAFEPGEAGVVKVRYSNKAARFKVCLGLLKQFPPLWVDHGERIRENDGVQFRMKEWIAKAIRPSFQAYAIPERSGILARFIQHMRRYIEANELGLGIGQGHLSEVVTGAATDF